MNPIKIGKRKVGADHPTFILAEVGTNHDASLDKALHLISLAAKAGADGVKFQLFRAEEVYPDNIGMVQVCGKQYDFFHYLQSTEMPVDWLPKLKSHCHKKKVAFVVTPFDAESLQACVEAGVDALKIASAEMNYYQLVTAAAATGLPVILSTGFSTMQEVIDAVNWMRIQDNHRLILLQCTGAYPTPPDQCHLAVMDTYASTFGCQVGFSDHTLDWLQAPLVATAKGACLIEKHFTDSRSQDGADHAFAIEPGELAELVQAIRALEAADAGALEQAVHAERVREIMGDSIKAITELERKIYPCEKRQVRARRNIEPGEKLDASNVGCLRFATNGSTGLHTRRLDHVLGCVAARRIDKGDGITEADLAEAGRLIRT